MLLLLTGHVCLNQLYFNTNFLIFHTFPSGIPESFQFIWNSTFNILLFYISNIIAFFFLSNEGGNSRLLTSDSLFRLRLHHLVKDFRSTRLYQLCYVSQCFINLDDNFNCNFSYGIERILLWLWTWLHEFSKWHDFL